MEEDRYALKAKQNAETILRDTPPGARNKALFEAALGLGRLIAAGRLQETDTKTDLHMWGGAMGLDRKEVQGTVESGLRIGAKEPNYTGLPQLLQRHTRQQVSPAVPMPAPSQDEAVFRGTWWTSLTDTVGECFAYNLPAMRDFLSCPHACKNKAGQKVMSLGRYADNRRHGSALEKCFGMCIDLDQGSIGLRTIQENFGGVCFAWYTTWSSTPGSLRSRLVIPFDRPCSAFETRILIEWAYRMFPGVDKLPPAQGFFMPADRPGYQWHLNEKPSLHVDAVLERIGVFGPPEERGKWRAERNLAERRIVAAVIYDPGLCMEMDLDPEDICNLRLREVYAFVRARMESGKPTNILDITENPDLPQDVIRDLEENVWTGTTEGWPRWVQTIKVAASRARCINVITSAWPLLEAGKIETDELIEELNRLTPEEESTTLADSMPEAIETLTKIQAGDVPGSLPTGIPSLDPHAPGPGNVCVVAARTSVGKSQLCLQVAHHMAQTGIPVFFNSSEMSVLECNWRLLSYVSGVSVDKFRVRGLLTDTEIKKIGEARRDLSTLPIRWGVMTKPSKICSMATRLQRTEGTMALFVDYLQRLDFDKAENRNLQVQKASNLFKDLAQRTGLVVYLASQVRRAGKDDAKDPPALSDLRDSGSIEQDADQVVILHREKHKETMQVAVAKNRHGRRDGFSLQFIDGHIRDEN